ncbi:hypothetical protein ABTX81_20140 [Kitasatospora sp. NPDC097605]|uniref:hypothetical protein n=1 Tax=Kitasatospora sp. NPDC097605 TaxID=3157226 RepID=UPI003334579B
MSRKRQLIVVALLLTLIGLAAPTTAQAHVVQVSCEGTVHNAYDPPLTATPRDTEVTVDSSYNIGCVAPGHEDILPGSAHLHVTVPDYSCIDLLSTAPGTQTITWADGSTTTYAYTRAVSDIAGTLVVTNSGTVTAGRFTGSTVLQVATAPAPNPLVCLTTGYSSLTAAVSLQILL